MHSNSTTCVFQFSFHYRTLQCRPYSALDRKGRQTRKTKPPRILFAIRGKSYFFFFIFLVKRPAWLPLSFLIYLFKFFKSQLFFPALALFQFLSESIGAYLGRTRCVIAGSTEMSNTTDGRDCIYLPMVVVILLFFSFSYILQCFVI